MSCTCWTIDSLRTDVPRISNNKIKRQRLQGLLAVFSWQHWSNTSLTVTLEMGCWKLALNQGSIYRFWKRASAELDCCRRLASVEGSDQRWMAPSNPVGLLHVFWLFGSSCCHHEHRPITSGYYTPYRNQAQWRKVQTRPNIWHSVPIR